MSAVCVSVCVESDVWPSCVAVDVPLVRGCIVTLLKTHLISQRSLKLSFPTQVLQAACCRFIGNQRERCAGLLIIIDSFALSTSENNIRANFIGISPDQQVSLCDTEKSCPVFHSNVS